MKRIFGIILLATLVNCGNMVISENEIDSVKSVLNFYGSKCLISIGFKTEKGVTRTYFKLEMSESDLINSYVNTPEIPNSYVAYLFYLNLVDDSYSDIKVKLNFNDGSVYEKIYPVGRLNEIKSLATSFQSAVYSISKKNIKLY